MSADAIRYERALLATSYLLGRRGDELAGIMARLSPPAVGLLKGLAHPDQNERARVLAGELVRLVQALDSRRLV
jgi:hypothetical protein